MAKISKINKFNVQVFMKEHSKELEQRSIAGSARYIKNCIGIKVSTSTIRIWGDMLKISFCKFPVKRTTRAQRERSKLRTQVKTLAVIIREICEDLGIPQHPGVTEIIETYAKNNIKKRK